MIAAAVVVDDVRSGDRWKNESPDDDVDVNELGCGGAVAVVGDAGRSVLAWLGVGGVVGALGAGAAVDADDAGGATILRC